MLTHSHTHTRRHADAVFHRHLQAANKTKQRKTQREFKSVCVCVFERTPNGILAAVVYAVCTNNNKFTNNNNKIHN